MTLFPTNHVSPSPRKSFVFERSQLRSRTPFIEGMLQDLMAHLQENQKARPICPAVTAPTEYLRAVLEPHWHASGIEPADVSTETLVLYLPSVFESVIGELAMKCPTVFNYPTLDFRGVTTYLCWMPSLTEEKSATEIWVPERPLSNAISSVFRYDEPQPGWVPVVMCAGQSVALGGFVVDDEFICGVQAACSCRGNVEPEIIYTPDEIRKGRDLAIEVGPTPWTSQIWSETSWGTFLAAEVYSCTTE